MGYRFCHIMAGAGRVVVVGRRGVGSGGGFLNRTMSMRLPPWRAIFVDWYGDVVADGENLMMVTRA